MWVGKFFVSLRSDSLNIKDFRVVIWRQDFDVENQENTAQKTAQKTIQKTIQKISAKQEEILSYLKKKRSVSRKELAENIEGLSESGVKYNLKRLKDLGYIDRVGPDKGGYWVLLDGKK